MAERDDPTIVEQTDAIIRLSAACICGSDLWLYRGVQTVDGPIPMGHEYAGIVEEVAAKFEASSRDTGRTRTDPLADGTLVVTPAVPPPRRLRSAAVRGQDLAAGGR